VPTLSPAAWPTLPLVHRGKVRDTFAAGDDLLMVASDRLSAFDVVLPTAIPGKGIVLTRLSVDWFGRTGEIAPNHLITADPAQFPTSLHPHADALRGRAMLVRRAERIDVECVVRGYLAGSAWQEYGATGELAGESLPSGLRRGDALPTARFTPAWKHDEGHDEPISRAVLAERVGPDLAQRLETISLTLYRFGVERSAERGLILADTKFEFGWVDGEITLIDELMTPDSSRYWDAATYRPGEEAASFEQAVRPRLAASLRVGQAAAWTRDAGGDRRRHDGAIRGSALPFTRRSGGGGR
jgi:phosphoribosylaminoimidazole-succinocarboxamide synthase